MLDFSGRWYSKEIIMQAMRLYLSYSLSYRDIEETMAEHGADVDHSTIQRWVEKYAKDLEIVFRANYRKHKTYVSWRMDETYIKVKGKRFYLYRAIAKDGDTIEFLISEKRDGWCFKCVAGSKIVQICRCTIGEIFWQLTGKFVAHSASMQMLKKMGKQEMGSRDTYAKTMIAA